ncbi:MAG: hypothetical protein MHMPM18_000940 [Marteilia pararefringens]
MVALSWETSEQALQHLEAKVTQPTNRLVQMETASKDQLIGIEERFKSQLEDSVAKVAKKEQLFINPVEESPLTTGSFGGAQRLQKAKVSPKVRKSIAKSQRRNRTDEIVDGKPECHVCKKVFGNKGAAFQHVKSCK